MITHRLLILLLLELLLMASTAHIQAQTTIWEENFDTYTNGTQNDFGRWTFNCSSCGSPRGVSNGEITFHGDGFNNTVNGSWQITALDISSYEDVNISIEVSEDSNLESADFIAVDYGIDGGAFVTIQTLNGDFPTTIVSTSGLNGTSLVLRVRARVNRGNENVSMDNVLITADNILPVELSFFKAKMDNHTVHLSWQTMSETNNSYFEVQKSDDGNLFVPIGKIEGNGNSTEIRNYSFYDQMNGNQKYYRLKQVDFDGQFEFSEIIRMKNNIETRIFPNPFKEQLTLLAEDESILSVKDLHGKVVLTKKLKRGKNVVKSSEIGDHSGVLLLEIESNNSRSVRRVVRN